MTSPISKLEKAYEDFSIDNDKHKQFLEYIGLPYKEYIIWDFFRKMHDRLRLNSLSSVYEDDRYDIAITSFENDGLYPALPFLYEAVTGESFETYKKRNKWGRGFN